MTNYTDFSKGSEWRKWDLHFHTPSSDCYQDKSVTNEDLIQVLVNNNISVVVITDHLAIDIERIKILQTLGREQSITVLPGIELKAEMRGSEPIHFIGIFSEEAKMDFIWGEINSKGEIASQKSDGKGENEIYCDLKDTCKLIRSLGGIITIHAGTKSNSIEVITNSLPVTMAQKKDIVENIDIFELGKPEDQDDYLQIVFPIINRRYPMVICSDNHSAKDYNLKENCWIKADPTFEGLKQIIYEPEGRVQIQQEKPEEKIPYTVLDSIRFIDSRSEKEFDDKWIELNPNLNSIIGGKSSGKSLLLYHIAKTIDAERIDSINEENDTHIKIGYSFENKTGFDFEVKWADGQTYKLCDEEKPNRPITYIPQLYLNRLAEEQKHELNDLVDKMLVDSSDEYKEFRDNNRQELNNTKTEMFQVVDSYYKAKELLIEKEKELKEFGDKKAILENQAIIIKKIEKLRKESSFSEQEEKEYNELTENIKKLNDQLSETNLLIEVLETAKVNYELFKSDIQNIINEAVLGDIDTKFPLISPEIHKKVSDIISKAIPGIQKTLEEEIGTEFSDINEEKRSVALIKEKISETLKELEPLSEKVKNKSVFSQLQKEQVTESVKLKEISDKQTVIDKLKDNLSTEVIKNKYKELYKCYQDIVEENRNYETIPDTDNLKLNSIIKINKGKFDNNFVVKINKKKSLDQQFGVFFNGENDYLFSPENHLQNINTMIDKITSDEISLNTGYDEKHAMLSLLDDHFSIDYNLLQDGDDLIKMSPGKRGIILFQLFLHLSKSTNPILIDQPEDNLDNRTVYQELNDFIRTKKSTRQIIIVSHNPNLVVSTDSENIIVANQDGQNKSGKNDKFQFEYVNGSIEHSFTNQDKSGILFQSGIRQHVCDVLEGGEDAFEKREVKYGLKIKK